MPLVCKLTSDGTKTLLEHCDLYTRLEKFGETAYRHKHLKSAVRHGGGGVMVWACLAVTYSHCGPFILLYNEIS